MKAALVILTFCLTFAIAAPAQEKGVIFCGSQAAPNFTVPVRMEPGRGLVVENATCGQQIAVLGIEQGYAKIQSWYSMGHVPLEFIKLLSPTSTTSVSQDLAVIECDCSVKVPVYSDLHATTVIANLTCFQPVSFLEMERGYVKIQMTERTGYVAANVVKLDRRYTEPQTRPVAEPRTKPVVQPVTEPVAQSAISSPLVSPVFWTAPPQTDRRAQRIEQVSTTFPMKYEGGSLPLDHHHALKIKIIDQSAIEIVQGQQSFRVPVAAITKLSYCNDVHRRVGPAIVVTAVTLGLGAPMVLVSTKKHYVGITWAEPDTDSKGGVVFKVGKGDYRGFLAALEGLTGKKAVNADVLDKWYP